MELGAGDDTEGRSIVDMMDMFGRKELLEGWDVGGVVFHDCNKPGE